MSSLMRDAMRTAGRDLKLSTAQRENKAAADEFDDGFGDFEVDEPVQPRVPAKQPQKATQLAPTSGLGSAQPAGRPNQTTLSGLDRNAASKIESYAKKDSGLEYQNEDSFENSPPVGKPQSAGGKMGGSWMTDNNSEVFNAKEFANTFFGQMDEFNTLQHHVPNDITSFNQFEDQFRKLVKPDVCLDLRLQLEYLNAEMQQTLAQLRSLERSAEQAVALNKDKRVVVSILYERKDAQNKVALLNSKKTRLLSLHEALEVFEDFAELSHSYAGYQEVVEKFLDKNRIEIPRSDPDPLVHASLAYQVLHQQSHGLAIDKEPVTDYMCLEYADAEDAQMMRKQIDHEYQILLQESGNQT